MDFVPLLFLYLAIVVPSISWGIPGFWNPDELSARVNDALLRGRYDYFDVSNFDYPSLPKYIMFGVGKIVYGLKYKTDTYIFVTRFMSAVMGGFTIVLTYLLSKKINLTFLFRFFAVCLTAFSSILVINAHYAHNDIYLLFFIVLSVYYLVVYQETNRTIFLFISFFVVGLSASSKYNGIVLFLMPLATFLFESPKTVFQNSMNLAKKYFLGGIFTIAGYGLGTPRAILSPYFYFQNMLPALLRNGAYGRHADSVTGLIGQWEVMYSTFGSIIFILYIISFLWFVFILRKEIKYVENNTTRRVIPLFAAIIVFDIPFWFSYNYQPRFFLPFVPLFSILAAFFIQSLYLKNIDKPGLPLALILGSSYFVVYSIIRVISVTLLFANDARIIAGQYLATIPRDAHIEYTIYPPNFPRFRFKNLHSYDNNIIKYISQPPLHTRPGYDFSENGLIERGVDYFIIDNFTYGEIVEVPFICENNPVKCELYRNLLSNRSRYKLLKTFVYELPAFLPQVKIEFVNPIIKIYKIEK